jgi:hypothetical protein
MTLGNMRDCLGVRSLAIYCWQCHDQAVSLSAEVSGMEAPDL